VSPGSVSSATSRAARSSSTIAGRSAGSSTMRGSASLRGPRAGRRRAQAAGARPTEARSSSFGNQRAEFELREQLRQRVGLGRADAQLIEIQFHRHVAPQRHELAREAERYPPAAAAPRVAVCRGYPPRARESRRDRRRSRAAGSRSCRQCPSRRECCRRCRDEREIVDDALGRYAEPLARIGLIHHCSSTAALPTTARVEERDAVADQPDRNPCRPRR